MGNRKRETISSVQIFKITLKMYDTKVNTYVNSRKIFTLHKYIYLIIPKLKY